MRVESLEEKPMFRAAFGAQRCVIPLAAFWEWPMSGGEKVKVRIARKDAKPLLVFLQGIAETGLVFLAAAPPRPLSALPDFPPTGAWI